MNKTIFILIIIFMFCAAPGMKAQIIPNAGFENWHDVGGWYDNPDDWQTNNTQLLAAGVVKDSAAFQDYLAMKVQNITNLPGLAYTRFALTKIPGGVRVFYKSNIVASDSSFIVVRILFSGSVIDSAVWTNAVSTSSWSPAEIYLSQTSDVIDTMEIAIGAGNMVGTWMSVDELSLDFSLPVASCTREGAYTIYPVPMNNYCMISGLNTLLPQLSVTVYNIFGQAVRRISSVESKELILPRGNLSSGIYTIIISSGSTPLAKMKLAVD